VILQDPTAEVGPAVVCKRRADTHF
jgi:hypothetical protein